MTIDPHLHRIVSAQRYPLLFATIRGAHVYEFLSPDSDYDLRGVCRNGGIAAWRGRQAGAALFTLVVHATQERWDVESKQ